MEIDVTKYASLTGSELMEFSASRAEVGDSAGPLTWEAALDEDCQLLTTPEQLQAARDHLAEYGAWDANEIAAWSNEEINALFLQDIAANRREQLHPHYDEENYGSGCLYQGDDEEWWFYLGS